MKVFTQVPFYIKKDKKKTNKNSNYYRNQPVLSYPREIELV